MKKRLILLSLLLVGVLSFTTACGSNNNPNNNEHVHNYSSEWNNDGNNHWKECECGEKTEVGTHTYGSWIIISDSTEVSVGSKKQVCSVCGYENFEEIPKKEHTHSYSSEWSYDETGHWYAATCEHTNEKKDFVAHTYGDFILIEDSTENSVGSKKQVCSVCGYENFEEIPLKEHTHIYADTFSYDETGHWYAAICGHSNEKKDFAAHTYGNFIIIEDSTENSVGSKKQVCSICGYENFEEIPKKEHTHVYSDTFSYDENSHWKECSCGDITEESNHTYGDWIPVDYPTDSGDGSKKQICSVCGYINYDRLAMSVGLEYNLLENNTYEVIGLGNCTDVNIVVPSSIGGIPVTSIGMTAFVNEKMDIGMAESIILPNTITNISMGAFGMCINLKTLVIPSSVEAIGEQAFAYCIKLGEIYNLSNVDLTADESILEYSYVYSIKTSLEEDSAYEYDNDFVFIKDNDDNYYLIDYIGNDKDVILPKNINEKTYDILSPFVFNSSIDSITISEGVRKIGSNAFMECSATKITILEGVTTIASYAFSESNIKSVVIPSSVTNIEEDAFYNCVSLESVTIPSSLTSIESSVFYLCFNLKNVIISEGVTSIGENAFGYCKNLTSITIPSSVTSIGDYAFSDCYKLVEVYNLSSLNITIGSTDNGYVGYYANVIHTSLDDESILIKTSDGYVFINDNGEYYLISYEGTDTELTLPSSIDGNNYKIYESAFEDCYSITSVIIPNGVIGIGDSAFSECESLTNVIISSSVISIENNAFEYCYSLTSVIISEGLTSIGERAFAYCNNLTNITISSSVTSIGNDAFYACYKLVEVYNLSSLNITKGSSDNGDVGRYAKVIHTSLEEESNLIKTNDGYLFIYDNTDYYLVGYEGTDTELTLPNNINGNSYKINDYAFRRCRSLTSIIIPEGVTNIGNGTFIECSSLKNIEILSSITSIGNFTFESCSSLENIEIPSSVTNIGTRAFEYCSSLISVIIPEGVISIGDGAFEGCVSLSTASIPSSLVSMGNYVFEGCDKLNCSMYDNAYYLGNEYNSYLVLIKAISTDITSCEIGRDTKFIYYDAFEGCSSLTSITIPSSVISIGSSAFKDCSGLTSITLPFIGGTINGTEDAYFGYIFGAYDYSSNYNFVPSTLENVIITGGTSIEYGAFAGCVSLKNITLPLSITSIGDRAFYYCSNLTKINIPSSVTSIGENVFDDCSNLKPNEDDTAYYLGNEENPYLVLMALKSTDVTSYEISSYTKLIYSNAFYYCESLTDIIIPNSVISIGNHIFERCHSLTNVYYYGTNEDWSNIMAESTNERLENATIYYYSETEPLDTTNKYWHYVDDIIVVW